MGLTLGAILLKDAYRLVVVNYLRHATHTSKTWKQAWLSVNWTYPNQPRLLINALFPLPSCRGRKPGSGRKNGGGASSKGKEKKLSGTESEQEVCQRRAWKDDPTGPNKWMAEVCVCVYWNRMNWVKWDEWMNIPSWVCSSHTWDGGTLCLGERYERLNCTNRRMDCVSPLPWSQDDSEDSETDGDEEDGSQSSTNMASRFHR